MPEDFGNDWGKSVAGVVIRDGKVLLVRHTYGAGTGRLIVPGGYIKQGESPIEAVEREVMEETGVTVRTDKIAGIRFNSKDWYVVFTAEYVGSEARSDHDENSEVVWVDVNEAMEREDVPDLTKKLLRSVTGGKQLFGNIPYDGSAKNGTYYFYGLE
ncbi:MAG: NUDIX hydrolase [Oscillospiraceae bacterium]|nr:NUDIX hydrolase [Oscillospiraceae bacterium]